MSIKQLLDQCSEAIEEAIYSECDDCGPDEARSAAATVGTDDGYIDIFIDSIGNVSAEILHDDGREHPCIRLARAIEDALPTWKEVVNQWQEDNPYEDEWTSHGFANEADYLRYRYG